MYKKRFVKSKISILLGSLVLIAWSAYGQESTAGDKRIKVKKGLQVVLRDTSFITKNDTILVLGLKDARKLKINENPYQKSAEFYDSLGKKTSRHKVPAEIFDFVVREEGEKQVLISKVLKSEEIFEPYKGYTIGSIVFKSVDLLEGSVVDTLRKATTKLGKLVNKIHRDTRAGIIEANLLFDEGDKVNPYQLADNERLLRAFKTLRDARIYLSPRKGESEVVDVVVVTQDVASIGASGEYTSLNNFQLNLYDINILGYAKQLQLSYYKNAFENPNNGFGVTLREQNFRRTFLQAELQYVNNYLREQARISFGRDFFTPEIKYAGGVDLYRTHEKYYFEEYDTIETNYGEDYADLWVGRSFELEERTNLIFSARLNNRNFFTRPYVSRDSNSYFFNRTFLLTDVTLTKRNYLKSNRITGFGKTEDVPVGTLASVLVGREYNEFENRNYFELNGQYAKYINNFGYLSLRLAIGSYFKNGKEEDGLLKIESLYFSDLVKIRKMETRHFTYFTYTKGFNRVLDRSVSIEGKWKSDINLPPTGAERITFGMETVYFMPWYAYGFQFALYHAFDINLLTNGEKLFSRDAVFPIVRVGLRTLNDYLVFPSLSIEIAYFMKNRNYDSTWGVTFSTTLPDLFGTSQRFKPQITSFN